MGWLSAIFAAFLGVALIAFGWQPCCCGVPCVTCSGLPTTLHGVFSVSGGNCPCTNELNGLAVTFTETLVGGVPTWQASLNNICTTCTTTNQVLGLTCQDATSMGLTVAGGTGGACFGAQYYCRPDNTALNNAAITSTSVTCPPTFQAVFSGKIKNAAGACPCSSAVWTLTVTT